MSDVKFAYCDLVHRQLKPSIDDPSADLCFHCLDNQRLFAHSNVVEEKWPKLLEMGESIDESFLEMPFRWKHINRRHFRVLIDKEQLNYLLELCYNRVNEVKDEFFFHGIERALSYYNMDAKKLTLLGGKSWADFFLAQLESGLEEHELILKYRFYLKYAPERAEKLKSEVTYHLFDLIKTERLALLHLSELPLKEVANLLKDDLLNVSDEAQVLEIVMMYVYHVGDTEEKRLKLAEELVPHVRFDDLVFHARGPALLANQEITLANLHQFSVKKQVNTRIPRDFLIVYGGWLNRPSRMCQVLMRQQNEFVEVDWFADKSALAYHLLVHINNAVYVIGGYDNRDYLKKVRILEDGSSGWRDCPSMWSPRCYASVCTDDKQWIYVCGGYNGRRRLRTVEKFDIINEKWYKLPPMHHHRSDAAAAFFKGVVVVAGGFNGETVMPFVEIYSEETRQWAEVWNMSVPRSGLSLLAFDNKLYAIGGYTSGEITETVEILHDTHASWRDGPKLNHKRSNFSAIVYDNSLLVMGGHDGNNTTKSVEVLHPHREQFVEGPELLVRCSAFRTCVLKNWKSVSFKHRCFVSESVKDDDEEVDVEPVDVDVEAITDDAH